MKLTQEKRVINKLKHDGFITRNECLRVYISRLGAIICKLKKDGWEFNAHDTVNGDYIYELTNNPIKPTPKPTIQIIDGVAKAVY